MNLFKRKKRLEDVYEDEHYIPDEEEEKERSKKSRNNMILWGVSIAVIITTFGGLGMLYLQNTKVAKQQAIEQKRLTQEELDKKNELTKVTICYKIFNKI